MKTSSIDPGNRLVTLPLRHGSRRVVPPPGSRPACYAGGMTDASNPDPKALNRLAESLGAIARSKGPPPVERWNPDFCGDIDMRIAADGTWFYGGTPIGRPALVRLFSTILRRDPERFVLVTPVERVGIAVEDAPFVAVQMIVEGEGEGRTIAFRTNVDDVVAVGPDHELRFSRDDHDGVKPYVRVRGELWARVSRALTYDLVELAEERDGTFGLFAGGAFFPIAPADESGGEP